MVRGEALKGVEVREPAEGWYWKAISGVLAAALAAIAVQSQAQLGAQPEQTAQVEQLQARLSTLEAAVKAPAQPDPKLTSRIDRVEARLAAIDEVDDWDEAARLGIAKVIASRRLGFTPKEEAHLAATIVREAHDAGVDPVLVTSVMQVESGFNPYAVSQVGAVGLMQLMPNTAGWLSKGEAVPTQGGHLFDLERNVHLGCQYLATLIHQFGSVDRALVAYNMGPSAARKALAGPRAHALLAGYPRAVENARRHLLALQQPTPEPHAVAAVARVERQTNRR